MTHPDRSEMLAHIDGELPAGVAQALEQHISECPPCAQEWAELSADLERCEELLSRESPDQTLALEAQRVLLDRLRDWRAGRRGISEEVGEYLGQEAANLVRTLEREGRSRTEVVAAVEPLLAAFLGRRAASTLRSHFLESR